MGANFVEIPVARVEARIPGRISPINLKPEYLYPVIPEAFYADNKPYITTSTLSILFRIRQESGILLNVNDWKPINNAMKKGDLVLTLITPPDFEDITLQATEMAYNSYTELVEIKAIVKKEK